MWHATAHQRDAKHSGQGLLCCTAARAHTVVCLYLCRYVLADTSQRSLVLVDELGKGTEVMWGTAIASLLVRKLVQKGAW